MSNNQVENHTRLLSSLQDEHEDQLTCPEVSLLLPEYHQAVIFGRQEQPRWAAVERHIRSCPSCAADYALLDELETVALGEAGEEPITYPQPVSPLSDEGTATGDDAEGAKRFWRVDRWGRLIIELTEQALRGRYDAPGAVDTERVAGLAEGAAQFEWQHEFDDAVVRFLLTPSLAVSDHYDLTFEVSQRATVATPTEFGAAITVSAGETVLSTALLYADGAATMVIPADALDELLIEIDPMPHEDGV